MAFFAKRIGKNVLQKSFQELLLAAGVRRSIHQTAACLNGIWYEEKHAELPTFQYASEGKKRDRRIYLWGFAMYGALGKPNFVKPKNGQRKLVSLHNPCRISFADTHDVTDVACGYGFTVFAVKSKNRDKIYGTGINTDSQIGYHAVRRGNPLDFLLAPTVIQIPFQDPEHTKVKQVACGRAHTLVLTDNEGIFSIGNNAYGQCGRPIVENEKYSGNPSVHKVRLLDSSSVKKIICGQDHTLFLTESGEVFACGWGSDGQTGVGHYKNIWQPTKVVGDIEGENIVSLSSVGDCVLAVSEKGDVFGWGNSEYKQLGPVLDEQQLCYSKYLSFKDVGKAVKSAAAGTKCALLNDKGEVYVWGYGILGFGPEIQHKTFPEKLPETLFGKNDFNPDIRVEHIACGLNHFASITNKGDLYMWGKNSRNCLGLGNHSKDQYFPMRVCMPAEVIEVRCGIDHTAALCKSFV